MRVLEYGLIGTLLAGLAFVLLGLLLVRLSRRPPRPLSRATMEPLLGDRSVVVEDLPEPPPTPQPWVSGHRPWLSDVVRASMTEAAPPPAPILEPRRRSRPAAGSQPGRERTTAQSASASLTPATVSRSAPDPSVPEHSAAPAGLKPSSVRRAAKSPAAAAPTPAPSAAPVSAALPATASTPTQPRTTKARRASPKAVADPQNTDTLATPVSSEPTPLPTSDQPAKPVTKPRRPAASSKSKPARPRAGAPPRERQADPPRGRGRGRPGPRRTRGHASQRPRTAGAHGGVDSSTEVVDGDGCGRRRDRGEARGCLSAYEAEGERPAD